MKKRTLLLGPCGDCKDRDKQKQAAELLGKLISFLNNKHPVSGPAKDAEAKAWMDAMRSTVGNFYLSGANTYKEIVQQYNKINSRCGFGFIPAK